MAGDIPCPRLALLIRLCAIDLNFLVIHYLPSFYDYPFPFRNSDLSVLSLQNSLRTKINIIPQAKCPSPHFGSTKANHSFYCCIVLK